MKKNILIGVICFLMLFTLVGCGSKTVKTTDEFKTIAKSYNYTITDVSDKYSSGIIEATYAESSDNWEILFFVFDEEANATARFNKEKETFEKYKGNSSSESSSRMGNYSSYTLTSSGYYMHVCRVDNTLLYARVPDTYKSDAKKIIKELGY